jgi:TetR/AcrR family transcriptional regulator, acrAB operon repressor
MARKTKEEAAKTREAILEAAVQVFSVRGVSGSTLANIAKAAGVTRGAIYWHFKNKEDLLGALWEQILLPFEPLDRIIDNPDAPDQLGILLRTHIAFFQSLKNNPRRLQLLQILLNKSETVADAGPQYSQRVNHLIEGQQKTETVLRNAVRQGQLAKNFDVRMGSLASIAFISGLIDNLLLIPQWIDLDTEIPVLLDGLIQMFHSSFLRSEDNTPIVSSKGNLL